VLYVEMRKRVEARELVEAVDVELVRAQGAWPLIAEG
jgi:hypothetical protein